MKNFEINGNLYEELGLSNIGEFESGVLKVRKDFINIFGKKLMESVELYVDNATAGSGATPITTPIFKKYVTIKLHIKPNSGEDIVIFQFSHELMHFLFYAKYGLNRKPADKEEESICTAASLISIHKWYPERLEIFIESVLNESNEGYRKGVEVAERMGYSFKNLKELL